MGEEEKTRVTGVMELVMKCLWKLTRQVPELVKNRSLDIRELLHQIHETLKQIPPSEYKKSAAKYPNKDLPVRTVKTLLTELTSCLGQDIFAYLDNDDMNESNIVKNYVESTLEAKKKKAGQSGDASNEGARSSSSTASEVLQGPSSASSDGGRQDSAKVLSTSVTAEQLAQDLQGLKISIQNSGLPIEKSIGGMPEDVQGRIRKQVAAASSKEGADWPVSETDHRQERFLELKQRLVVSLGSGCPSFALYANVDLPLLSCKQLPRKSRRLKRKSARQDLTPTLARLPTGLRTFPPTPKM
jgi:hypothetical protein